jgi:starch-binding outer membrane protein, SusD/RagB family
MPYLEVALQGTDNFGMPRLSYNETAQKIAEDCDRAAALLPGVWDMANLGRPTQGAAMALKASTLLFAASPKNNETNDMTRWTAAATAAWDLINLAQTTGRYKLLTSNGTDQLTYDSPSGIKTITYPSGFDSIFMYTPYNDEIIWEHYTSVNAGNVWRTFTPKSLAAGGIIQGFSPSQNIVDLFETDNGLKITDDSSFDPQNPFVDRDPRFYHTILFNNQRWTSKSATYLELFEGGRDRPGTSDKHYSTTGYLARKFWAKNVDMFSGAAAPSTHVIYFRYAEILLMYAEACNEIGGPTYVLPGASLSAVAAVNLVRDRAGMPDVATQYLASAATFRERIKNERAVELYLEGKRFFDLSRWGDAHKLAHREIYGASFLADASKPTGYTITRTSSPVFTLVFDQKHYRWPIRTQDALMFKEFKQNPGW